MNPSIREIGSAIYGPRWQRELARAIGMSERRMRRIVAGETPLSEDDLIAIREHATDRHIQLKDMLKRLP